MNRALLSRLSLGPYSEFIQKFKSSRYEFIGVELHDTLDRHDRSGHKMLASGHQGQVNFHFDDILSAIDGTNAVAITLVHNHPRVGSELRPSRKDIHVTEVVHQDLLKIGLQVLDHRIYGANGDCLSFVDAQVGRWGWEVLAFP